MYADIVGLRLDVRRRLSDVSTCGRNAHHSWSGHSGATVANDAMKWYFAVLTATSAALN